MTESFAITDAIVALLNAQEDFPLPLTAARIEQPLSDLTELNVMKVSLVPGEREITIATREGKLKPIGAPQTGRVRKYRIDAAVQIKFAPGGTAPVIDPYLELAEEIGNFLLGRTLADPPAKCVGVAHPYLYFPDHWEKRLFTSTLALTYQIGP